MVGDVMLSSSEELVEVVTVAVNALDVYPDYSTKAAILVPAVAATRMLYRRTRCCRAHRRLALLSYWQFWCLRQFFLRVGWRNDRMGFGLTIWFWAALGNRITILQQRFAHRLLDIECRIAKEGKGC